MEENELKIPAHIAIIMDGNGRWAKARHMPRTYGHAQGAKVLEQILEDCSDLGVEYFTVYAFSTENWARPYEEVKTIMDLFRRYLEGAGEKCMKNNVRLKLIGERSRLSKDLTESVGRLEEMTKDNTGITFTLAINYGARDELVRASKKLAREVKAGNIDPEKITEDTIGGLLDTAGMPDPDLLIRTSGEQRLSNFLLWQLAYTEFYFTDVAWPDFNKDELIKAIEAYSLRGRRYGKLKEQQ